MINLSEVGAKFDIRKVQPFVINSTGTIYQFAKGITSVL
jgi:hypothetical protein